MIGMCIVLWNVLRLFSVIFFIWWVVLWFLNCGLRL